MALVVVAALCLAGALVLFLAYPAQAQGDGEPPARPTGLEASEAAGGGVDLAWDDPEDDSITGYEVLRRDRAEHAVGVFETIEVDTGSKEAAYTDATAQAGGSYVYRVKAINTHGVSEWSSYDRIDLPAEADDPEPDPTPTPTPTPTPDPEATPEDLAPTGLEVNLVENRVTLTWEAPAEDADSVTGYEVLRAQGDAELTTLVADTESAATGYVDATANEPGVRYTYRVKALRGSDVSQWSNFAFIDLDQDYTPPEPEPASEPDPASLAPSNLTAGIVDDGVSLSWDAPAEDADSVTGYEILRAQGEAELTTLVADTESTATSYTDTTATEPGETYAYRVKAIRDEEKSQGSNQAEVLIPHTPEDLAPANLTAGIVDDGVALRWDAPAQDAESVTGYEVYRAWTSADEGTARAVVVETDSAATAWTDRTDKEAGVRHAYRVRALRDAERSQWSNSAHVDLPGKGLGKPEDDPPVGARQSATPADFNLHANNDAPWGVWSNGTTMWVADETDDKLYAYVVTPRRDYGDRDSDKDFDLAGANGNPQGIWSDETTMWVADWSDDKLYAYVLTPGDNYGDHDSDKDFDLVGANGNPQGIWSDETTMWVADVTDNKLYAYVLTPGDDYGDRDSNKDIDLVGVNSDARGIWADETTMWVADYLDDKLFAYLLTPGADYGDRVSAGDMDLAGANSWPGGIWADGSIVWVVDVIADKLFTYVLPANTPATGAPSIRGILQQGETLTADTTGGIEDENGIPDGVTYSYQWVASDGGTDTDISGATGQTYTLTASEVNQRIKVRVSFVDDGGFEEALTSAATGAVVAVNATRGLLWLSRLEAQTLAPGTTGYVAGATGSLGATAFTAGSLTYQVTALTETFQAVSLRFDPVPGPEEIRLWVLAAGGEELALSEAVLGGTGSFQWPSTDVSWSDGEKATLALKERVNVPVFGEMQISLPSAQPTVGEALRLFTSAVGDRNGKPADFDDYSYQWSADGVDIPGATAAVYWPADSDAGKTFSARMEFTDGDGFMESITATNSVEVLGSDSASVPWSSTVTVGVDGGYLGYDSGSGAAGAASGELFAPRFSVAGVEYTVGAAQYDSASSRFILYLKPGFPDAFTVVRGKQFLLDAFPSGEAAEGTDGDFTTYSWSDTDPGWSAGDRVAVALRLTVNRPATGAPSISGPPQAGHALTADTSGIIDPDGKPGDGGGYAYQWTASDGGTDADIAGANGQTYTLTASEAGQRIKVRVSFTDGAGFEETLTSAPTSAVAEASSTSTRLWAGTVTVGVESAGHGYDATFDPVVGSIDDDDFTDQGAEYAVKAVVLSLAGLVLSLDPLPGSGQIATWTLTVDVGDELPLEFALADATPTPTGTGTFYIWDNPGLSWDDEEEVFVALRQAVNAPAAGKPAVTGEARVDETLTADVSGITDENGIPDDASFTYQWIASDGGTDADIDGADGQTYTLTSAEVGKLIKVRVGFTDSDGFAESVTSDPTGAVSGTDVFWSATMTVGVHTSGFDFGYGSDLPDSTLTPSADFTRGSTDYTVTVIVFTGLALVFNITPYNSETREAIAAWTLLVDEDEDEEEFRLADATDQGFGQYLWFTTGLSWSDGDEVEVALKQVSVVNVAAAGAPAVTGTARVGELLTADVSGITDENGITDDAAYSYQWVSSDGVTDTDLPGATGPAYLLSDAEEGRTVRVRVGFTDSDHFEETLTSAATGPVAASSTVRVPWSANLTVGEYLQVYDGYDRNDFNYGQLEPSGFTHQSTPYTVTQLFFISHNGNFQIRVSPTPGAGRIATWTLVVGGREFRLNNPGSGGGITWSNAGLTWAEGDQIAVGVKVKNSAATGKPAVTGTAQVGETLTADPSGISDHNGIPDDAAYSYQWIANDGTADADIDEATDAAYTLTGAEVGKTVRVRVSFTDADRFAESRASDPTVAVTPPPPPNVDATGAPAVSGAAQAGELLTADVSGIADENGVPGDTFTYQWTVSDGGTDTEVRGADGPTYLPWDRDIGKTVKVRVSFTDSNGYAEGPFTSAATAAVTASPTGPVIWSATLTADMDANRVGYRQSASLGALSDHAFTHRSNTHGVLNFYLDLSGGTRPLRFLVNPDPSAGAVDTWTLIAGDSEFDLSTALTTTVDGLTEFQWNMHGLSWSAGDKVSVGMRVRNRAATGAPAVTGTAQAGELLSADTSGIADANGIPEDALAYQWIVSEGGTDTEVPGADGPTYLPWDEDIGKTVKVRVSFTDEDGFDEGPFTSAATAAVAESPTGPVIWSATLTVGSHSGGLRLGLTPTITGGGLSDPDFDHRSTSYTVAVMQTTLTTENRLSFGVEPDFSTGAQDTWTLIVGDSQFDLARRLGGVAGFTTITWNSPSLSWSPGDKVSVGVRVRNRAAEGAPIVGGTAQVGETLTADPSGISDRNGVPDAAALAYQWVANDGATEADIDGAAGQTYTLTDSDKGKTIRVRVSFTDGDGFPESRTSDPTGPVAAVNYPATGAPALWGIAQVGHTLRVDVSGIEDRNGFTEDAFFYRWLSNGQEIVGAYAPTYPLELPDQGATFRVFVFFIDGDGFQEGPLYSPFTAPIAPPVNHPATGAVVIRGTAQVGRTLTADTSSIADENGIPAGAFTYQWHSASAGAYSGIVGATGRSYTLTAEEEGKTIGVRVSFTDGDGFEEGPFTSPATAAVTPPTSALAALSRTLPTPDNSWPFGIWSDGETVWLSEGPINSEQLYAYRRSDMSRRPERDIVFATEEAIGPPGPPAHVLGLLEARGVWGYGETLWVADANHGMLYAFSLDANADGTPGPDFGARHPEKDIALDPANGSPYGMAGLGVIVWVADWGRDDLFAYNLETGARVPGRDIDLHQYHIAPTGVWSNGDTFWVADSSSDKLYAYNHADGGRDPGNDVDLTALSEGNNNNPWGLWAGGGELLVVEAGRDGRVFVYNFHPRPPAVTATPGLSLPAGHSVLGLWGDGPTLWAVDDSVATLRAYTRSTGLRDPDRDIALATDNTQPNGIWGNDETLWVVDFQAEKLFAYDRSTGARDPDRDIEPLSDSAQDQSHGLTSFNFNPSGLWGSGGTVWVWGGATSPVLLAYDVDTGAVNVGRDIPLAVEGGHGKGMWGDGTVLWVADHFDEKLYAYDISARRHAPVHDFDMPAANDKPWGIWSDGRVLWASQFEDHNLHTHDFTPRAVRASAASVERTEATLEVSVFRGYLAEGPLYLAYRTLLPVEEEEFRVVEVEMPADGSEVEFTLTGLTPRASYQVLASLDRDFPADRTERALFTTARDPLAAVTVDICGRTPAVQEGILAATPNRDDTCEAVSAPEMEAIAGLDFTGRYVHDLKNGDFAGLPGLRRLDLSGQPLDPWIFDEDDDGCSTHNPKRPCTPRLVGVAHDVFAPLGNLVELDLSGTDLTYLPLGMFDGLTGLRTLLIADSGNPDHGDGGAHPILHRDVFKDLGNLRELDLRPDEDDPLHASPLAFRPLTSLETYNGRPYAKRVCRRTCAPPSPPRRTGPGRTPSP